MKASPNPVEQPGDEPERRPVMATDTKTVPQGQSPIAEEATTKGSHNPLEQPGDKPERRPVMATDTKTGADRTFEVMDMAKTWKEGYLKGLETSLQWQEQNQQLVKEAVRHGLSAYQQWLALYKNSWDKLQGQTTGVPSQFLAFTRGILQTSQDMAEPLLKNVCERSFDYYETAVAGPARKYTVEINKKVMDTIIPN